MTGSGARRDPASASPDASRDTGDVEWELLRGLQEAGKLTPAQARLMAPTRPREELYDLESDPYEIHNLADSPAHAAIRDRLRGELEGLME